MTATERLRAMLDERGVEYVLDEEYGEKYPPEKRVTWSCDLAGEDMTVTARDYCINIYDDGSADYCLDLEFHEVFTPEQAIAATLGTSQATDEWGDGFRAGCDAANKASEESVEHYKAENAKLREKVQRQADELTSLRKAIEQRNGEWRPWKRQAERFVAENAKLRELVRDAWGDGHPDRSCEGCDIRDECHDDTERLRKDGMLRFSRCLFELRIEDRMRELGIEVDE